MKTIFVTGGAGYIGTHTVKLLLEKKNRVIVYDNFSNGNKKTIPHGTELIIGDLLDTKKLEDSFSKFKPDSIIHFAGLIEVGESVLNPQKYYINNVVGTLSLLSAMIKSKVKKIVFSSSAAIYGNPQKIPIKENDLKEPTNPYGHTKEMAEKIFADYNRAYGLNCVSLRYFNAAGADKKGEMGESHNPETHLIPLVLDALSKDNPVMINGDTYDTSDGTCVRDYVHVDDLANAHFLALKYLEKNEGNFAFNIGSGKGFSVKQIIAAAEKATNKKAKSIIKPCRKGDPGTLLADISEAKKELKWEPGVSNLKNIIDSAWRWGQKNK